MTFWQTYGQKIIFSAVVIIITVILQRFLKLLFKRYEKSNGRALYRDLLASLMPILLWIICIITIGSQWQTFSSIFSTLLTSSGVLALGLSLAAQESLTNLIDGIFISYYKPFEIGDRISLPEKNIIGTVSDMNLRHTVITTFNNTRYIVSNSTLYTAIIENTSNSDTYTYMVPITISYDSDVDKAKAIISDVISSHRNFVDKRTEAEKAAGVPIVNILFSEYAASGITLKAAVTTPDVGSSFGTCSDVRYQIKKRFDREGIKFPFTTITIENLHQND